MGEMSEKTEGVMGPDYGIRAFQSQIESIYLGRDSKRGKEGSTLWFIEEVGELIRALRRGERENLEEEFADVFAWMSSLASIEGIDLAGVVLEKYGKGCPRCKETPCGCPE